MRVKILKEIKPFHLEALAKSHSLQHQNFLHFLLPTNTFLEKTGWNI